jgi:hypothetical protein
MPQGDFRVQITTLKGDAVEDRVELELQPLSGDLGVGGTPMRVLIDTGSAKNFRITGLPCRGGPGTMYRVQASARHYRHYSFFQSIQEDLVSASSDDIEFWVKPGDVSDILAPEFAALPDHVRTILTAANMRRHHSEDNDLLGQSGESLYQTLGPLRKACLLNIAKKTAHHTSDNCLPQIEALLVCRQDRFFAFVSSDLPAKLLNSPLYKSAGGGLHKPLPGFAMTGESFKTHDPHANLQVTFMEHVETGRLAADIDIDESSGIEHGFEVIRNSASGGRTNPYLIREFMLSADRLGRSLDPGYAFLF